jgi:hypothetical protein
MKFGTSVVYANMYLHAKVEYKLAFEKIIENVKFQLHVYTKKQNLRNLLVQMYMKFFHFRMNFSRLSLHLNFCM